MKNVQMDIESQEKQAILTNTILEFAIVNKLSFDNVQQAVEDVKKAFLSDGLIRRD